MSAAVDRNGEAEGEHDTPAPTWRHLSFYEIAKVRDPSDFGSSPTTLSTPNELAAFCFLSSLPAIAEQQQPNGEAKVSASTSSAAAAASRRRQSMLVGDVRGWVRVLDAQTYTELASWQAFHGNPGSKVATGRVTHLSCDDKGRLITLGEDDGARFPIIRIWDLSTSVKGAPRLLTEGKVQHGSRPHPIAALAHTPLLSFLSIGLADGSVLLLRNLDEALSAPTVSIPKFKVAFQPSQKDEATSAHDPVTGLGFAEHASRPSVAEMFPKRKGGPVLRTKTKAGPADTVHLFIVTLSRIMCYTVLGKGAGTPAAVVDDVGCALGCAQLVPSSRHEAAVELEGKMVVARDEAIYVIGTEGREMSLAYEGPKSSIRLAATQLIIVSPPMMASAASNSATVRNYVAGRNRPGAATGKMDGARRGSGTNEVAKVTVFDLENKLIAYSGAFQGGVRETWVGCEGDICVLGDDGSLTRLMEKSLRQKLDVLFRKSLYVLAINVAKSHVSRSAASSHEMTDVEPVLADIYRKYGDYLYEKGDFEGSMNQFVKTIGNTQPSYVIRRFLDAQRITNLTTFLQELHARGMANSDHTTLLLNCYTKLKDVASLDRFIKRPFDPVSEDRDKDEEDLDGIKEELPFDLDTAIRVCRQAGYFEHAAYLAKRYSQHDEYIRIQIEDLKDYDSALEHIRGLGAEEAERHLIRYGKAMLDQIPRDTTDLLIELSSGAFQPKPLAIGAGVDGSKTQSKSAAAAYLTYLQVGAFGKVNEKPTSKVQISAAEPSATSTPIIGNGGEAQEKERDGSIAATSTYAVPSPRLFFAHFLNHLREFERFLETVALARWGQSVSFEVEEDAGVAEVSYETLEMRGPAEDSDRVEQISIWNTLLELYLTSASSSSRTGTAEGGAMDGAQAHKEKALKLLKQWDSLPYDISQALMVCSQEHFQPGIIFLYERLGMYEDILRLHMEASSVSGAEDASLMNSLARYGDYEPQLYPMLLRHLCSSEELLSRHQRHLEFILDHIEEERLMSPLEVVQALSKKGAAKVGLLRAYLIRSIQGQKADMETNSKLTMTYRNETLQKLEEIASLKDLQHPKIFQQTKCNACGGSLDLPIVHFMCKHSFHGRCLGEEEKECPLCAKSHGVILEIRKNNLAFGERQDLFLNEVEEAEDGFDVVASMFSKGLFGPQQLGERQS